MIEIAGVIVWSFAVGFTTYWLGYMAQERELRKVSRELYYLRKWANHQAQALIEADLELELERIRNAR